MGGYVSAEHGKGRGRRGKGHEDGADAWAKQPVDALPPGDFDFDAGLAQFNKAAEFDAIRSSDSTQPQDRLVSVNRVRDEAGTPKLGIHENVLDGLPKAGGPAVPPVVAPAAAPAAPAAVDATRPPPVGPAAVAVPGAPTAVPTRPPLAAPPSQPTVYLMAATGVPVPAVPAAQARQLDALIGRAGGRAVPSASSL